MVTLRDSEFPDDLLYDIENQIWYTSLDGGLVRAGFTQWSANLMGEVIVFTPKRLGRDFEKNRSFAIVEGGKWVGAARAGFDGVVVAHNELLERRPGLLNTDPYREGWMLIVRPSVENWRDALVTGADIAPAFEAWFATDAYKDRTG